MTINRRRFIAVTASAAFLGGPSIASDADAVRWQGTALGARADIRLYGMSKAEGRDLLREVRAEIDRLESIFSLYRSRSALVQLNTAGVLAGSDPDLLALMTMASKIHAASGGAFDPTIQPVWRLYAENRGKPSAAVIASVRPVLGWDKVSFSPDRISLPQGGGLTFNGIAQGYVTDAAVRLLRRAGLRHALVEAGEISALGASPSGDPWSVRIENLPVDERVWLKDSAVATSATDGTMFSSAGPGHIVDPGTGRAGRSPWRQVSVVHPSAAVADGLSTACVLMNASDIAGLIGGFPGASFLGVDWLGEVVRI